MKVYSRLATLIENVNTQRFNGDKLGKLAECEHDLRVFMGEYLPHGSGFDSIPTACMTHDIFIVQSFHCMDDCGMYAGWLDFKIKVWPTFHDYADICVILPKTGLKPSKEIDVDFIKEYIESTYYEALNADIK